jgi:putative ABC transport system permease protein
VIRARLTGINGNTPAAGGEATREAERNQFMRRREQNLSWRFKPDEAAERITAGQWMRPEDPRIECSLEQRFAKSIGAKLGDTVSFDVQGVPVESVVTSLRQVRWASLRPNFFVLLSPHALLGAPVMWIAAIPQVADADRARLPGVIAAHFPNVTAFDIADTGARVTAVIDRVVLAVRGVAALALVAGLAVLIGVALSTARARRTDAALIAVLGGGRHTLLASLTAEFATLGLVAAVLGAGQGILHAWAVAAWFELPLTVPFGELALLAGGIALAATVAGVLACRRAMSAPPLTVLRDE